MAGDLIDTLWNVKEYVETKTITRIKRFNRYIVECKVIVEVMVIISALIDLIDTLWNVKVRMQSVLGLT